MYTKRSQTKSKPKKIKTKVVISVPQLKKKVQRVVNKWVRERDSEINCISCQKYAYRYHAGHYIAQGSSGYLRYNEDNLNKQCNSCNLFKHANLIEYRIHLVIKIGEKRVKYLENQRFTVKKWKREELEDLLERYRI